MTAAQQNKEESDSISYRTVRCQHIDDLKQDGYKLYPQDFSISIRISDFIDQYDKIASGSHLSDIIVNVAGRISSKRGQGKLVFYDIEADGCRLQLMASAKYHSQGLTDFKNIHEKSRRGDIIGVKGWPGKSNMGELSVFATDFRLLSFCQHMLPPKGGLENQETRYRQRYLDGIVNPSFRDNFRKRNEIIQYIRRFFENRDFLEVETPMMNKLSGGASAKPFVTFHNDLDMQLFLRVAPELYLKMCVIAGLDRVFEIGRVMRNESIDLTHNPEFSIIEMYEAYSDYYSLMSMTEVLISELVQSLNGSMKLLYHSKGKSHPAIEIDFTPPWRRISMIEELEKVLDVKFPNVLDSQEARTKMEALCNEKGLICSPPVTNARLLDKLAGEYVEKTCINPTFICDHPVIMSPLAKEHRDKPGLTERFELFVNQHELCNAYSELNDPEDQAQRFADQARAKSEGDDEAMHIDKEYIKALEYGLPPTAGWGLGIDRLTMLICDVTNIREVLLFPAMRPEQSSI